MDRYHLLAYIEKLLHDKKITELNVDNDSIRIEFEEKEEVITND